MKIEYDSDAAASHLKELSAVRVYFGHQSVGANIIDGLRKIMIDTAIDGPPIIELGAETLPPSGGVLLHSYLGTNRDPISKFRHFEQLLNEELPRNIDVALCKLCYIDFDVTTAIDPLLADYKRMICALQEAHPRTLFVHVTAPVRYCPESLGVKFRELLGRPNKSKLENCQRTAFNDRLRQHFHRKSVFDLAAAETTSPDKTQTQSRYKGRRYENLIADYTDDGGHLNEAGAVHVAAELLRCLASVPRPASTG